MASDIRIKDVINLPVSELREVFAPTKAAEKNARSARGRTPARADKERDETDEDVRNIAQEIQSYLKRFDTDLRFELIGTGSDLVVRVLDPETGRLIKEVPAREILAVSEGFHRLNGLLYNAKT